MGLLPSRRVITKTKNQNHIVNVIRYGLYAEVEPQTSLIGLELGMEVSKPHSLSLGLFLNCLGYAEQEHELVEHLGCGVVVILLH